MLQTGESKTNLVFPNDVLKGVAAAAANAIKRISLGRQGTY
jgi:hypothetical protein